jgi:heptosyltransferase-2
MKPIPPPQRIAVLRLDRLGDVVLSTPIFAALRRQYPHAYIAAIVRPQCRDAIEGHPAVNDVFLYDKDGAHRSFKGSLWFASYLKRCRFDTAIILYPSTRSHWLPLLARIPVRIGFRWKSHWQLTHALPHRKQEGRRHESLYGFDLLEPLGIQPDASLRPSIAVPADAAGRVDEQLARAGIGLEDPLVVIHPSASCISKRWMPERFAQVADRLIQEQRLRVCLVAGPEDTVIAEHVAHTMRHRPLNLAGRLTVAELAALLRRARLLISNDSGPVHVAAAVGTPVVDIFGRNGYGLSPTRWAPIGEGHVVLQKEVGCATCLAQRCDINFLCLTTLQVQEVYDAACRVLNEVGPAAMSRGPG